MHGDRPLLSWHLSPKTKRALLDAVRAYYPRNRLALELRVGPDTIARWERRPRDWEIPDVYAERITTTAVRICPRRASEILSADLREHQMLVRTAQRPLMKN